MPKRRPRQDPKFDWATPQHEWVFPLRVPLKQGRPTGPAIQAHAHVLSVVSQPAIQANEFIAFSYDIEGRVKWCKDFDNLLCAFESDGSTLIARRKATTRDLKRLGCPQFIQGDEWPLCCGM